MFDFHCVVPSSFPIKAERSNQECVNSSPDSQTSNINIFYRLDYLQSQLYHILVLILGKTIVREDGAFVYEIAVVTDLDHESKSSTKKNTWQSFMKKGVITVSADRTTASVIWHDGKEILLTSSFSAGGRSMELSDLGIFNGHLVSIDDRTGLIYIIEDDEARPWVFLSDGPGNVTKGFKGEWLTVKDGELWVGGLGKEWTTTEGVFVNHNPMWVKRVTVDGCVTHVNWVENYKKLRLATGITYPGYMIHESAQWSDIHRKWFFMPRRASNEMYTEAADETRGTNYLLVASEDFSTVEVRIVGKRVGPRGFSAFQFIPETNDKLIVALKSEEKDGIPVASYITIYDFEKNIVLLDEQPLQEPYKYEGIAFI
ncbi:unnamed protein product [Enterobius vermicularis]|uniref:Soluble calcium-activated nucleotidase 1 n=1 Tax=Enterobius vermicularis TaxID=51028 RepID=A0A3P6IWS6_ENTVE|nr:unnamed protein product [Enterobius vermicularis]